MSMGSESSAAPFPFASRLALFPVMVKFNDDVKQVGKSKLYRVHAFRKILTGYSYKTVMMSVSIY